MTRQEQSEYSAGDTSDAEEFPLSRASLMPISAGKFSRSLLTMHPNDHTLLAPSSIAETRAQIVRYAGVVTEIEASRAAEAEAKRIADAEAAAANAEAAAGMRRWSYQHGKGFILSERFRQAEAEARKTTSNPVSTLAPILELAFAPPASSLGDVRDVLARALMTGCAMISCPAVRRRLCRRHCAPVRGQPVPCGHGPAVASDPARPVRRSGALAGARARPSRRCFGWTCAETFSRGRTRRDDPALERLL